MGETADAIRHDIEHRRQQMTDDVQELEERAKSMMDWRQQIQERPMAAVGVAAAGGLLLGMLTGGSSDDDKHHRDQSARIYQPMAHPSHFAAASSRGNGHDDGQQSSSGVLGFMSGQSGPSGATDVGKQRAATKMDEIRGALMGLAAAKAEEFLREAVPGFSQEVEKVQQKSASESNSRETGSHQRSTGSSREHLRSTDATEPEVHSRASAVESTRRPD